MPKIDEGGFMETGMKEGGGDAPLPGGDATGFMIRVV